MTDFSTGKAENDKLVFACQMTSRTLQVISRALLVRQSQFTEFTDCAQNLVNSTINETFVPHAPRLKGRAYIGITGM